MKIRLAGIMPKSRKARVALALFIVLGLAIAAFLIFFQKSKMRPDDPALALRAARQAQIDALNRDSDGDGLKDWEEVIFRTDPHNPDTDGDGTPDGEEVRLGRDPLKANTSKDPLHPNDMMATSTPLAFGASDILQKNLTRDLTDRFLKRPVAQALGGQDFKIDPQTVNQYADQLLQHPILSDAPKITASDIRTTTATNPQSIIEYFTSFDRIFSAASAQSKNEVDIATQIFQSQDYSQLQSIKDRTDAYQKAIADLKSLPVPSHLQEFHLTILNYLSKYKRATEIIQNIESDPIAAMLAIQERIKLDETFTTYIEKSKEKIVEELKKS